MSVFRNIGGGTPIEGLDYEDRVVSVGVALGLENEIRLALRGGLDTEVILTHNSVRRLIARLQEALKDDPRIDRP